MAQAKIKKLQGGGNSPSIGGVYDNKASGFSGAAYNPSLVSSYGWPSVDDEWLKQNSTQLTGNGTTEASSDNATGTTPAADAATSTGSSSAPTASTSEYAPGNEQKYGRVNINGILYRLTPNAYRQILSRISGLDADEDFVGDIQTFLDYAKNPDNVLYFDTGRNTGSIRNRNGEVIYDTHISPRSKFSAWWGALFNSKMNRYNRALASVFGAWDPEWFKVEEGTAAGENGSTTAEKKKHALKQLFVYGNVDSDDYTYDSNLAETLERIDWINDYYNNSQWSLSNELADDEITDRIFKNIERYKQQYPNFLSDLAALKEALSEPWKLTDSQKNLLRGIGSGFDYVASYNEDGSYVPMSREDVEKKRKEGKTTSNSGSSSSSGSGSGSGSRGNTTPALNTTPAPTNTTPQGDDNNQPQDGGAQQAPAHAGKTYRNTKIGTSVTFSPDGKTGTYVDQNGKTHKITYVSNTGWQREDGSFIRGNTNDYLDDNGNSLNNVKMATYVNFKNGGVLKCQDGDTIEGSYQSKADGFSIARLINAGLGLASAGVGFIPIVGDAVGLIGNGVADLGDLVIDLIDPKVTSKQAFGNFGANLALSAAALIPGGDAAKFAEKTGKLGSKLVKGAKKTKQTTTAISNVGKAAEDVAKTARLANQNKDLGKTVKAFDKVITDNIKNFGPRTQKALTASNEIIQTAAKAKTKDFQKIYDQSNTVLKILRQQNVADGWRTVGNLTSRGVKTGIYGYGLYQGYNHLGSFADAVQEKGFQGLDADDYRDAIYGAMPLVGIGRRVDYRGRLKRAGATPETNNYWGRRADVTERIDAARDIYNQAGTKYLTGPAEQQFIDLMPGYNSYTRSGVRQAHALSNLGSTNPFWTPASTSRSWLSGGHHDAGFFGVGTGIFRDPQDEQHIYFVPIQKQGGKIKKFQWGGNLSYKDLDAWLAHMQQVQSARLDRDSWNGVSGKYEHFKNQNDGTYDFKKLRDARSQYNINYDAFSGDNYGGFGSKTDADQLTEADYKKLFGNDYDPNNIKQYKETYNQVVNKDNLKNLGLGLSNSDIDEAEAWYNNFREFTGKFNDIDEDYAGQMNLFNDMASRENAISRFKDRFQKAISNVDESWTDEQKNQFYADKWKETVDWANKKYSYQGSYGNSKLWDFLRNMFKKDYNKLNLAQSLMHDWRSNQISKKKESEMLALTPSLPPRQEYYNIDASPFEKAKADTWAQYQAATEMPQTSDNKALLAYQSQVFGKAQDSVNKINDSFAKQYFDTKEKNKQIDYQNNMNEYKGAEAQREHMMKTELERFKEMQDLNTKRSAHFNQYLAGKASRQIQKEDRTSYLLAEEARQLAIKSRTKGLSAEEKARLRRLYEEMGVDSNFA